VRALDLKLLRDLRRLWAQALAIAAVQACGVAVILMSVGLGDALERSREATYERGRFADIFAGATRAPRTLMAEIEAIPGVAAAEARIVEDVLLDLPGRVRSAQGRVVSLPETGEPRLNLPHLRSGRWPDPASRFEVVVTHRFAEANGFRPGDSFAANLEGSRRTLTIVGTAGSPEFLFVEPPGGLMPDDENFGIVWMPQRAAAAAFDMEGAFDDVSLALLPRRDAAPVIDALDGVLSPYGGLGAHDRDLQTSHATLTADLDQLRAIAYVLPPVFLAISAYLTGMVLSRLVRLDRAEIGLLKAIGYSNGAVLAHYLALAALIAAVGVLAGWALGTWLARAMASLYARFYDFPTVIQGVPLGVYAAAGAASLTVAALGAARSALAAARLSPAVAMSPPAPPSFRRGIVDRIVTALRPSQPTLMILRSVTRWPVRAGLTALGLALATSVLVSSRFFPDSLDVILETAFDLSNRQDAMVLAGGETPLAALEEVRRMPGVIQAEPQAHMPALIRHGPREKRVSIQADPRDADLARVVGWGGRALDAPEHGLLLSDRLAERLDAAPGDVVEVELLAGRRGTHEIPVAGIVDQFLGLGAYMDLASLDALQRRAPQLTNVNVTLDPAREDDFHAALKDTPGVAGAIMTTANRRGFEETIEENILIMTSVYTALAVVIAFGVAYNQARAQLSERARELAILRILGFGRGDISYVLMGETMLLAALAQPVGWWLGHLVATALTEGFSSDLYAMPLAISPATYASSSLIVLGAALGSALLVRRRLDRLDLVAVMKTRE
jgi:putative ABC transport system permease protein